ncbi:MAG: isoprenyl transferase [Zymomonas mobilis]|uniref:Isoprenyl transferase n=1 Tax=Zymomonas mobilis subsp. mobilis (strain ATCC 10988 / DSM 424 / LMG 404 / NCIMB 8938 / NRRL B-806 / ZM1) TaxID=555217 RepID=A0A0H3FW36_ZYMMA|nr:isoprenyl transferase [Zymomonas mobilis]ACV74728.1 undecaprenyl diphosphate synthase [Zymomonas mobilis subsp. mobilis NCIMB 11163]AEH62028.1 undecaprenyl diphosphate synthase [Zymomonas mobilis subsp. mobilis ATCC 10988]AHB09513.1 Undecaprenyl pyrophosphate synthetase [Zymomonas mobilis subsp. mobilis str. CP4 = NRRL B-14023]AHJ69819.1 Undecaprenyl pyrophosphate synthase [Zymomonas mobilis subsp. mobilis NRRL B-12526]AHJ71674.1 Undecaprenyl pyrophosphate synthase [Zymomonas mobilis subsp.
MIAPLANSAVKPHKSASFVPRHVAIIMDGNGRWASARHLPRIAGHKKGADAVKTTVRAAAEMGIEVLTLYAFSSENWRRPASEVADLMGLLRLCLRQEMHNIKERGICLKVIGDYTRLDQDLVALLNQAIEITANNTRLTLVFALNYGAQDELVHVTKRIAEKAREGQLDPENIDVGTIESLLYTHDLPPLDLVIRTSGEKRLSNFLLWQAAYAELLFIDTLWPDFGSETLKAAVEEYARRERRYGGL